jgi:hypothetical protein
MLSQQTRRPTDPVILCYADPVQWTLDVGLTSECIRCGAERDATGGQWIVGEGLQAVAVLPERCRCGEARVRVRVRIDDDGRHGCNQQGR